ncbi:MAG: hypothetical protein NTU53_00400 [Planctomycetota bacterium]|nr:hypothetical protein [Planctomycetota bacterium]
MAIDEIQDHQDHVHVARLDEGGKLSETIVARDAQEPRLAQLLLLHQPAKCAIGLPRSDNVVVAKTLEVQQIDLLGLEQFQRLANLRPRRR